MKVIVIIAALLFTVASAQQPIDSKLDRLIKQNEECEKTIQEPKDLVKKVLAGQDFGDRRQAGVMALCVFRGLGYLNEDGSIIQEKFKERMSEIIENELIREQVVTACGQKNGDTPEEAALVFGLCLAKHLHS